MKRLFAVIAVLLTASLASCAENGAQNKPDIKDSITGAAGSIAPAYTSTSGSSESGYPSAEELNAYYEARNEEMRNVCDGLYYHAEDNVKLLVLRCQDDLFAFCAEPAACSWEELYIDDLPIDNGEFGFLTADVTFESGGIDGCCNRPQIRRMIDFEKTDIGGVLDFYSFPVWEEGYSRNDPMVILEHGGDKYCIFRCRGGKRVEMPDGKIMFEQYNGWFAILDGKVTGYYDYGKYRFEDVITLLSGEKLVTDGYDTEIMNSETIAVFRVGDKYYSFGTSIFLNKLPTPIYNDKLENRLPEGYELNDGDCAIIQADIKLLNGNGWVNVPMTDKIVKFEECDYDIFIDRLLMSPVVESEGNGDDWYDVMFDRTTAGTWLVFVEGGKYMVYLQSYPGNEIIHDFIGSYDTLDAVKAVIYG